MKISIRNPQVEIELEGDLTEVLTVLPLLKPGQTPQPPYPPDVAGQEAKDFNPYETDKVRAQRQLDERLRELTVNGFTPAQPEQP